MELLERDEPLAALEAWLEEAGSGAGLFVLVSGEAGVGKTSLLRAFCDQHADAARVWWGACDALSTPRPLGPLHDIAREARGDLAALMVSDVSRHERLAGFLDALDSPLQPTVAVIEDVHWADEATRDLLVYVARRVALKKALVVATFRDDEVGREHPLRDVLGHIATMSSVERLALRRLSPDGVAALSQRHGASVPELFKVTAGNPFFVTEVLASPGGEVPMSVSDAVLLRAHGLRSPARVVLDLASVIPDQAETELILDVSGQDQEALEECLDAGLVLVAGSALRFRHELARLAIEGAIPPVRRQGLHREVLAWLGERSGVSRARLAYHAERGADPRAILTFAPPAAEEATRLGAHHEAYDHLERALPHAGLLPDPERAELLESFARASRAVGRFEAAFKVSREALELRERLGDSGAAALVMVQAAMSAWSLARNTEAHQLAERAIGLVEALPAGRAQGQVYASVASLRMLARDIPGAIELGTRALSFADACGDTEARIIALGTVGAAQWFSQPDEAEATMIAALETARSEGEDLRVAGILGNLGSGAGEIRRYATADRWLAEARSWAQERDLDHHETYAAAWSARSAFEQGRWTEADELVGQLRRSPVELQPTRIVTLTVQGRLAARRGEREAADLLGEAWDLAARTGDLQRLWPAAAGQAELAWLAGDSAVVGGLVGGTYELALRLAQEWPIGELGFWLWRVGELLEPPEGAAEPFARQIAGDWGGAASAWERIGCPYEVAVALADSDDEEELRRALEILGGLGAAPMADRVAARLRTMGVRDLPRRPSRATVANPGGLTNRQLEVLALLDGGRTNPQIAAELHISPKTVGHHVSAILDRLGVEDRREAVRAARRQGMLDDR